MKSKNMRTPNLEEIFTRRNQYQLHKKKLHQIYEQRKSQLGYDSHRIREFDHIKENKAKSFVNNMNRKSESIARENVRFLGKLENVKPSLSRRSVSEEREKTYYSFSNPYAKQKMLQTQKQNMRISNRMRNMSSSLNQKSFIKDYAKSQQIKNRLMKYAADQEKVQLKSERYFNDDRSVMSESKEQTQNPKPKIPHRQSAVSHYRREDIMKNKIDTSTNNLAKIRAKNQRPNTSFQSGSNQEQRSFFATEPRREKANLLKQKNRPKI